MLLVQATVEAYDPESGEHTVYYHDGVTEK